MDLVIRNAVLDSTGELVEVGIANGLITAVEPAGLPLAEYEIDAEGGMISPAFIESHFHLENALLWDGVINQSGTLHEAIELYAKVKKQLTVADREELVKWIRISAALLLGKEKAEALAAKVTEIE